MDIILLFAQFHLQCYFYDCLFLGRHSSSVKNTEEINTTFWKLDILLSSEKGWKGALQYFFYMRTDTDPVLEMLCLLVICEFVFLEH